MSLTYHFVLIFFLAGALMLWFRSDLAVTLTKIARFLGWKKHDDSFWPSREVYDYWTRGQWQDWLSMQSASVSKPVAWGIHLISCPYCMAFHLSWMSGLLLAFVFGWSAAVLSLTYPALLIIILRNAKYE